MPEGGDKSCAGGSQRVTDGDGPPIHVHALLVEPELAHARDGLRGERLVELDQVQLIDGESRALERLARGRNRSQAHRRGVHAGHRAGDHAGDRPPAKVASTNLGGHKDGGCPIVDPR